MGFSNLIAFFMMVATAATLHAHGVFNVLTTAQAAEALKPITGEFAFVLFALGIVGTGMLALPVPAGSAAYAISTLFRLRKGLEQPWSSAKPFYAILIAAMAAGLLIGMSPLDRMKALCWAAVINAVISVPIMIAVMIAASKPHIMGAHVIARRWKILGWLATAAMACATLGMGWTFVT